MAAMMLVNKAKRRTSCKSVGKGKGKGKGVRRKSKRSFAMSAKITDVAKTGAIGSVGALAGTVVGNLLPLPASWTDGALGPIVHALIGIGTGFAVSKFADKKTGIAMAQGAVTVALYDTLRGALQKVAPNLNLQGYDDAGLLGYDDAGLLGAYADGGVGAYVDDAGGGMGYAGAGYTGDVDSI